MMEEPIGVMKCWECVEKHSRDMEHHLEDIIRVTKNPQERLKYEDWIDRIREMRRQSHMLAKDISINPSGDWKKLEERHRAILEAAKRIAPRKAEVELTKEEVARILGRSNPAREPIRRERGATTYTDVYEETAACHPQSYRARKTDDHVLTFCCPYGLWDERLPAGQQCVAGMMLQKIEHLHAEGQSSCPVCSGA